MPSSKGRVQERKLRREFVVTYVRLSHQNIVENAADRQAQP